MTIEQTFDVPGQLDAIERSLVVEPGTIGPSMIQRISRVYRTDADDLWDAVTNPERLPRRFAQVDGDLRLGGRYQVKDNAGGTIERCEPPHLFEATWELMGGISWVLVTVDAEGAESARLTLEHRGEAPDEFWTKAIHLGRRAKIVPPPVIHQTVANRGLRLVWPEPEGPIDEL